MDTVSILVTVLVITIVKGELLCSRPQSSSLLQHSMMVISSLGIETLYRSPKHWHFMIASITFLRMIDDELHSKRRGGGG